MTQYQPRKITGTNQNTYFISKGTAVMVVTRVIFRVSVTLDAKQKSKEIKEIKPSTYKLVSVRRFLLLWLLASDDDVNDIDEALGE